MRKRLPIIFLLGYHTAVAQLSLLTQNPNGSPASDDFSVFVKLGDRIVFNQGSVENWSNSSGLWQSDGTVEGTSLLNGSLRMIAGAPYHNCVVGNRLFFVANGLWRTDGTPQGTAQVIENYAGNGMAALDDILIFSVPAQNNSETAPSGLWRSDGTAAGTYKFADIRAQFLNGESLDGFLYFMSNEPGEPFPTLWKTNGTTTGTSKASLNLDTPWGFSRLGNKLIFKARYHHEPVPCNRGTSENPLIEYYPQEPDVIMQIQGGALSIIEEPTYDEYRPYGLDGCVVKNYHSIFTNTVNFYAANNLLFFLGQEVVPHAMNNLWRTDGTPGGTVKLTNFPDGDQGVNGNYFISAHVFRDRGHTNLMYFSAETAEHGSELWRSDGTAQGTFMLKDINPGSANSYPNEMRTIDDITYFFAYNPDLGQELWQTDGTPEGTVLVTDLNPGAGDATYRREYNSEPYNFFGTSLGNDYIFGGITGPTAGLFTTKNIAPPPTLTASLTEFVGGCSDCEITLSKIAGSAHRNQYDLFTRGHFSTPVADKYNVFWDNAGWNLRLLTRNNGTVIEEWQQMGPQAYNGLNTSPKPPCTGWSNGVSMSGDCQAASVSVSGNNAPAMNVASIRSLGIINNKNAYEIPVIPGQEGEKVTIEWDGTKWVIKHSTPNTRTSEDIVLSQNALNYGANPPCGSWSNGYELSGDVCSVSSTLPVKLISFSATKAEQQVQLNWSTASESNSDRFDIQRSNDGKIWQLLGSVAANSESQQLSNYQYRDVKPANGSNLYRLKMIDKDSTFSLSSYQNVNMEMLMSTSPFPNPTSGKLTFELKTMAPTTVRVVDLIGRTLIERSIKRPSGSSEIILDTSTLSSGLYVLQITGPDFDERMQFVKK